MRKVASIFLSIALAVLAPGLAPYEALAGVSVRKGGSSQSGSVNGKFSAGPNLGVSHRGVQAIAPGAVVSNLVTINTSIPISETANVVVAKSLPLSISQAVSHLMTHHSQGLTHWTK